MFPAPRPAAAILGLATATPPHFVSQTLAAESVITATGADGSRAAWIRRTFSRMGVERRATVLPELAAGRPAFGGDPRPGTGARMAIFRAHAAPLAAVACRGALARAGVAAADVTHLVVVTCTGFHAPGPDVELIPLLGLREDVDRTIVGFMGCYGAFAGLRSARRAVEADPAAVALLVCVELCSLHMRDDPSPGSLIAHGIFADGAAACVLGAARGDDHVAVLGPAAVRIAPGTEDLMRWTIGGDGFEMTLAPQCPARIGEALAEFVRPLAAGSPAGRERATGGERAQDDVVSWCVHPGGPSILAAAEQALGLGPDALASSRAVLRDHGNMSSATILFVLEHEMPALAAGARGVALGFGPGLTLEGFLFVRGARVTAPRIDEALQPARQPDVVRAPAASPPALAASVPGR